MLKDKRIIFRSLYLHVNVRIRYKNIGGNFYWGYIASTDQFGGKKPTFFDWLEFQVYNTSLQLFRSSL